MGLELNLLDVSVPGLAYICLGGFVVAFSTVWILVKDRLYINEVVLGTLFGILMGPHVANIFNPRSWGSDSNAITLEIMRIVLATGLFAIGVELPKAYMAKHAKGLLVMVVPTMALGWIVVAAIIRGLFPTLTFVSALAIAACLTPTDPIICAAIVGGKYAIKHVPQDLREILSAESAANDGLAYPFLTLSIYLTVESSRRTAISKWFLVGCLYQVLLGVILGALLGVAFSYLLKLAHIKDFIDRKSYVAQYIAFALFTIGIVGTIGSDDLLAAFAAGTAVSWDGYFHIQTEGELFPSVIELVLNCACFVYIGAWLPFDTFNTPHLGITLRPLFVLLIAVIILRRIPPLLLLYKWIPEITNWREAIFSGHYGPMGVGAIFISSLALTRLPTPHDPPQNQQELLAATLQPIVSFIVLGSIIIHGLSIPFVTLGRKVSLLATLTSRSRGERPDWLQMVRPYTANGTSLPGIPPDVDVERVAAETSVSSAHLEDANTPSAIVTLTPNAKEATVVPMLATASGLMERSNRSKVVPLLESNQSQIEVGSQDITTATNHFPDPHATGASGSNNMWSRMQSKIVRFPASIILADSASSIQLNS